MTQHRESERAFSRKFDRCLQLRDRLCEHPFLQIRPAKPDVGQHKAWVQLHCFPILLYGPIILPGQVQDMPNACADCERKRVQFLSFFDPRQGLIESPHCLQVIREEVMRGGVTRIEAYRLSELRFRPLPVPVVLELDQPERSMRLRQSRVEGEGPPRCLFGLWVCLVGSYELEKC